ncbi:MAG: PBS lyase HEAT domain-containing protein repeat-containing [Planctomycetota bacterium]|nr:MAG: PBS lyase HEAT domain-containing protein repeat-containing [Planctomycetota bacterium]
MPISTSCSCGRKLNLKDELAGKTVKCPQCGTAVRVPDGKSTATAVATPPPRSAPADSRIMEKPGGKKKKDDAGPKIMMANFKSLDDFDEGGNLKKKKKEFTKEDEEVSEAAGGTTGGEMAKIAAEALKAEKEKPKFRCPGCGRGVKPEDVICTKCGTNIKTGRRIGESAFTLTPKKVMIFLAIAAVCALGAFFTFTKVIPPTAEDLNKKKDEEQKGEIADTIAKMTEIVNDSDPDHTRALPYVANVGAEALPALISSLKSGGNAARRKAVKLMEILAFNGYRSEAACYALGALSRDSDATLRDWAAEALQWSGFELVQGQAYCAASEADSGKTTDVVKLYALPFNNCRQILSDAGVAVKKNPKLGKIDNSDSHPARTPLLPIAGYKLQKFYEVESGQSLKVTRLIQAVRAGRKHRLLNLIFYLEGEPCKNLGFTPTKGEYDRSYRCLVQVTGRQQRRFDEWMAWWKSAGKVLYPDPKDPTEWASDTPPEKAAAPPPEAPEPK